MVVINHYTRIPRRLSKEKHVSLVKAYFYIGMTMLPIHQSGEAIRFSAMKCASWSYQFLCSIIFFVLRSHVELHWVGVLLVLSLTNVKKYEQVLNAILLLLRMSFQEKVLVLSRLQASGMRKLE